MLHLDWYCTRTMSNGRAGNVVGMLKMVRGHPWKQSVSTNAATILRHDALIDASAPTAAWARSGALCLLEGRGSFTDCLALVAVG